MKKFLIIFVLFLFAFVCHQAVFAGNMTCTTAMKQKKPFVVLYSADYCTYCRRFKPVYAELSKTMSHKYNFVTVDVSKKQNNGECEFVNITSIPTLYIFNPKNGDKKLIPSYLYYKKILIENKLNEYYASLK